MGGDASSSGRTDRASWRGGLLLALQLTAQLFVLSFEQQIKNRHTSAL
jgi:hypothetical protein